MADLKGEETPVKVPLMINSNNPNYLKATITSENRIKLLSEETKKEVNEKSVEGLPPSLPPP